MVLKRKEIMHKVNERKLELRIEQIVNKEKE